VTGFHFLDHLICRYFSCAGTAYSAFSCTSSIPASNSGCKVKGRYNTITNAIIFGTAKARDLKFCMHR